VCLGKPFRITRIRANRKKPGLQPQHLAAVRAAAAISQAVLEGDVRDSQTLDFMPGKVIPGNYHFDIGTAGSTSLVLQTVLPALIIAASPSKLVLEGGTHNPLAPPYEFLRYAFLPILNKMGATINATLEQPGFAPLGGGKLKIAIQPTEKLKHLHILGRGKLLRCHAEVLLSNLPVHIAERELAVISRQLSLASRDLHYSVDTSAKGAGNLVAIIVESENITECITALGRRGLPAERVAELAVRPTQQYLDAGIAVGSYLADQLLLYLALAGEGSFLTGKPSLHTLTNMAVIERFLDFSIDAQQFGDDQWKVSCAT
jgi:RNA 3'-terminal phosphate cyclase (ATP)